MQNISLLLHPVVSHFILLHISQKQGLVLMRFLKFNIYNGILFHTRNNLDSANLGQSNLIVLAGGKHKLGPERNAFGEQILCY